jgi:Malonate decarboxylase, alpha subunit, transporter
VVERRLGHREEAEEFYRDLKVRGLTVRVGMEASGHARWFERLLTDLQFELWIGDAVDPEKLHDLHLIISSISRPEHVTLFELGIAKKVDFAFAGPQSLRVAQLLEDGEMKILLNEAAGKADELQRLRLEVFGSRPIVEGVLRQESAERDRANAEKIAADLMEKKRLAAQKATQELSDLEAQVAEFDRRNTMESTRPGLPVDIGREGTTLRAAHESRLKHERDVRERLRVLRAEMTQKGADEANPNGEKQ